MYYKKYDNHLTTLTVKNCQFGNNYSPEGAQLLNMIEQKADDIKNADKVLEIFSKIKSFSYYNNGQQSEDGWHYNLHLLVINGDAFTYKTGVGIPCENQYTILFDAVFCLLYEANIIQCYSEDDFLEAFGYTENIKSFRNGINAYRQMDENSKKIKAIFGEDIITNIHDIIEL